MRQASRHICLIGRRICPIRRHSYLTGRHRCLIGRHICLIYEFELLRKKWWREQAGDSSWVAALYLPPPENLQLVLVLVLPVPQIVQLELVLVLVFDKYYLYTPYLLPNLCFKATSQKHFMATH